MTSTFSQAPSHTLWTSSEISRAIGTETKTSWVATGVSIDTRTLNPGDIFIALRGEGNDGHAYVAEALNKGAAAIIAEQIPAGVDTDRVMRVNDTFKAMQDLGQAARERTAAKIFAVTGSVGKTGTKDMLFAALSAQSQAHCSQKSYNNHFGVPLSLSRMQPGTDYGVFELGMNHAGEIMDLTRQVRPHIAIITAIAPTHMEFFPEGLEGIARAKAEIFSGMDAHGIAIINGDMPLVDVVRHQAEAAGVKKIFTYGFSPDADAALTDILVASNGARVKGCVLGDEVAFTLRDAGEHNAVNAMGVLLAIRLAGADMNTALHALEAYLPATGRGNRELIDIGDPHNPVTLIDESYNASPVSMQAAFKVLALIDPGRGGRRVAILGDMLELGKDGPRLHAELALPLKAANVDLVYTCGMLMKNLYDKLPQKQRGLHRENSIELASIVPDVLAPGDVVMVKGSLGSKMDVVVEALRALPSRRHAANA